MNRQKFRIPEGRLDKARFYVTMAEDELTKGRMQSAENFLRLALMMDPANAGVALLLKQVAATRNLQRREAGS